MKSLKSTLTYWQEIVFTVSIGLLLLEITRSVMLQQTMDEWDIFLCLFFLPLFICLIGQFFWKNEVLGIILSILLGLSSVIFILMSLYFFSTTSTKMIQAVTMFIFGIFLLFASFTMPKKYN
jgi:hypothetical protein